jgi:hypothetical protein
MSDEPDVYVSNVIGPGTHTDAVVSTVPIKAGDLTTEHGGKSLGLHDAAKEVNLPGKILRIEHHDESPPSVSVWFRYPATPAGVALRDGYMRVAPYFELQLVETLLF